MRTTRLGTFLGIFLLLAPVLLLVTILQRAAVNIPRLDDYDAVLSFLLRYRTLPSPGAKLWWVLTSQHAQYKLITLHAVTILDYAITGQVNFTLLQWLGNAALLVSVWLLWVLLARSQRPLSERIWLFVPVLWIFLAPEYFETLDWAMGGLQNFTVIAAALGSFLLLTRPGQPSFAGACALMLASIFCSGNGFMVSVAGALLLLLDKRWRPLSAWVLVTLCGAGIYALDYSAWARPPLGSSLIDLLTTPFIFLGSAVPTFWPAALLLGIALVAVSGWFIRLGWHRREPASFAVTLFIFLSSALVGLYRHGLSSGLASRYKIYSLLLACILWIAAASLFPSFLRGDERRNSLKLASVSLLCILLSCAMTYKVDYIMVVRKQLLLAHLRQWADRPDAPVLVPDESPVMHEPQYVAFRKRVLPLMRDAVNEHIYEPPITIHTGKERSAAIH